MHRTERHIIVANTVAAFIEAHHLLPTEGTVVVAVSGGSDSLCLLHLLHSLCGPDKRYATVQLAVAHLDHQLRPELSHQEAEMVAQLATSWNLPVTVGTTNVAQLAAQEQRSLEDAARVARYRFLRAVAHGAPIAVAHHRDDQAETLLLHWLRGGGISSMVGLQPRLHDIIRPLLSLSHADTQEYCRAYGLTPIEDASNHDPRFLRNRIRHELLPLLSELNPGFQETLLRNAEVARIDSEWIEQQVTDLWTRVIVDETQNEVRLACPVLRALPLSLQRHILRRATARLCDGQSPLELRHYVLLEELFQRLHSQEPITLHLPVHLRAILRNDILCIERADALHRSLQENDIQGVADALQWSLQLRIPGEVDVPGTPWRACAEELPAALVEQVAPALQSGHWDEVWRILPVTRYAVYITADFLEDYLHIRTRRPGDRIRPLGMQNEKKVQDVLIDARVPREERAVLPLFFSASTCIWLGGVCLDERVRLTAATQRIVRLALLPRQTNEE